MRTLLLIICLILGSCAHSGSYSREGDLNYIPLCVSNADLDPYAIYYDRNYLGRVYPGEKRLFYIPEVNVLNGTYLYGRSQNGVIGNQVVMHANSRWEWRITTNAITTALQLRNTEKTICDK